MLTISYKQARTSGIWLVFIIAAEGAWPAAADQQQAEIQRECPATTSNPSLGATVLGYVTPWNGRGYDVAKIAREKLTHVSPVWYQLKATSASLSLTGAHDVDQGWIAEVRGQGGRMPRIVPRVVVEMHPEGLLQMLTDAKPEAIHLLAKECKIQKYDGLVLEVWSVWHAYGVLQHHFILVKGFLKGLAKALHKQTGPSGKPMELILAVPPAYLAEGRGQAVFAADHCKQLVPFVDGFSLMTYDWNIGAPGPNAPFPWVEANVRSLLPACKRHSCHKVFLGLNFYGRDFAPSARKVDTVLGHDYTRILEQNQPNMHWHEEFREHVAIYQKDGTQHYMYYPSKEAILARLTLATNHGFGISIWELGQGLDEFMDIL